MTPTEASVSWTSILTEFANNNSVYLMIFKIFATATIILLILSIIPLTKDLARGTLKHKYRITAMWIWNFLKAVYTAHKIVFTHLIKDKDDIFTSLEKTLKKEEDKLRNR